MSAANAPILQETIQLDIKTPEKTGLEGLLAQLEQVKRAAGQVDAALAKATGGKPLLGVDALKNEIIQLQNAVGGPALALKLPDLSKAFGLHLGQWRDFIRKDKTLQKEFASAQSDVVRSAPGAARLIHSFQSHQAQERQAQLARLQTPTVGSVIGVGVKGKVGLEIPASQIEATVAGVVKLIVPAEQVVHSTPAPPPVQTPAPAPAAGTPQLPVAPLGVSGSKTQPALPTAGVVKTVGVEGPVKLEVLGGQVQASVTGVVELKVPAGQIAATADGGPGGGGRDPATGRILPGGGSGGSGGGGGGGGKKKLGPLDVPPQPGEFARRRVEDAEGRIRETVSRRDAAGHLVDETWDNAQNAVNAARVVKKSVTGESPLQEFKRLRTVYTEMFRKEVAELPMGDKVAHDLGLMQAMERHAGQLQGVIHTSPYLKASLGKAQTGQLQEILDAQAGTLRARQVPLRDGAVQSYTAMLDKAERKADQRTVREHGQSLAAAEGQAGHAMKMAEGAATMYEKTTPDVFRSGASKARYFSMKAQGADDAANLIEAALRANPRASDRLRSRLTDVMAEHRLNAGVLRATGGVAPGAVKPGGEYGRFLSGLQSFSPMGFLANTTKVAGWATAVTMLYKSVELARYSLERFIEVGEQTARLDVVFRKTGGTTEQLTGDLLKLAAANSRNGSEAMGSATEWARLGLSRQGVGEATRVSLAAANVAHMKPEETTKQLSTLMHVFELDANDLNGVLGMLTATSQRYNVTLEDLFTGLDRSAATAKQAKVSLAELQALIAVMVGRTGQTGIIVGNTVKNIFTQFNNPTMQRYLRMRGVETMVTEGENRGQIKSGSQILRDVFVRYSGMKHSEQADMGRQLAGRLQVGRFQSLMEGYVDSQKLAVDTQLRLNAAQEANARILGTLKGQLTALRVEWDRLAMRGGQRFGPDLANVVRAGKNSLRMVLAADEWMGDNFSPVTAAGQTVRALSGGRLGWKLDKSVDHEIGKVVWAQAKESLLSGLVGPLANPQVQGWLAKKFETPYERGEQAFQNKVQELQGTASSSALKARLFETVKSALPGALANNPEMASTMQAAAAGEMSNKDAEAFRAMAAKGDRAGMGALLGGQAKRSRDESLQASAAEMAERDKNTAAAKQGIAALDKEIAQAEASGKSTGSLIAQRDQLTQSINANTEARTRSLAVMEEELGKTEQAIWIKQQYTDLLRQQDMLMQNLDQVGEQGNPNTMGTHLDARVGTLKDEVALLEAQRDRLEQHEKDVGTPAATQAKEEMQKRLSEKQAELAGQNSPQMRQLAAIYDARAVAERRSQTEVSGWAFGPTESHRLINEEHGLQGALAVTRAKARFGLTDNEAARAKQLEVDLTRTQEQIQVRIVDLARQEKQIRMDSLREFNKGLLLAGPGELLQRLQVSQMMQRKVSPGEFFAMSPDVRRMYFEARGGDAMMTNRWEQRELSRTGHQAWSVERDQAAQGLGREQIERWNGILRRNTLGSLVQHPDLPLPGIKEAQALTDSFMLMNSGVLTVTVALATLTRTVDTLNRRYGGGEPRPAGSPRFDISPGYAPGAAAPGH